MFDVFGFEHFPFAVHQILHMPNGHGFEARKISSDIMSQEAVNFSFPCIFSSKLLSSDVGKSWSSRIDLLALSLEIDVI